MKTVIKKWGNVVQAYCLRKDNPEILRLIKERKLRQTSEGCYEIFSRESVNGRGEIANEGDYVKIDSQGFPYPNKKNFFEKNHRHIEGDCYEQIPQPLSAWSCDEEMCPEVQYLINHKKLVIDSENPEKYFNAQLWGTTLSATRDAVIIFYHISKDAFGTITDMEFNFVEKKEFEKTYTVLSV